MFLAPTLCHGQDVVFSDDFEWGSICAWSNRWYPDLDGDGYGDQFSSSVAVSCPAPAGLASNNVDCDDLDEFVHPLATEICDGVDNDCDFFSADGSGDPLTGAACDGSDSDLCEEGTNMCDGGVLSCSDETSDLFDVCDGADNDCDASSADGSEDPLFGVACDGADSDLCQEGTNTCIGGTISCSDDTSDTLDVCDGADNDCDGSSADGTEDPLVGVACDGADSDLCEEGTNSCNGGSISCSDVTSDTLDVCDGVDNDCDSSSADGAEDPLLGAACDGADSDLCLEGSNNCSGGSIVCSDTTGNTVEACNGVDDDCDGSTDEDFNRNDNPLCVSGTTYLGSLSGDTGSDTLTDTFWNEEWDRFTVTEDDNGSVYLSARIVLTSPPGTDFDLYVYCASCGGLLAGSSVIGSMTGHDDVVVVRADDEMFVDDTFDVIVEVRHFNSTVCANWNLNIFGNITASAATCD
jgi:hypothetical protein